MGIGQSTVVGIGGDPVVGSSFIDILTHFEADPDTDLVVMVGEIGGAEEEKAAEFISSSMSTPVVAYIAGFQAPPGKQMGHAGAIITGSSGTAEAERAALSANGVPGRHEPDRGRPAGQGGARRVLTASRPAVTAGGQRAHLRVVRARPADRPDLAAVGDRRGHADLRERIAGRAGELARHRPVGADAPARSARARGPCRSW